MSDRTKLPIPVQKALRKLGRDISAARRRRRITMALMGERANLGRATVGRIEKGDPAVSMGGYASVVFVLGMTDRLNDLIGANHDQVGRELEEENLPKRVRLSRTRSEKSNRDEQ